MQEESLWSSFPVYDVDTVLPNRYGPYSAFSLLYCDLYLRDFKKSLKHTMLDQESVFEDQIHELHRLYRRQKALMMEMEETNNLCCQTQHFLPDSGIHWMDSCISTSKASVFPPEEAAFSKINEARISGDDIDKCEEKVMDLELPSYEYLDIGEEEEEEEEGSKNGEVLNFPKDQSPIKMSLESVVQPENLQLLTGLARSKSIVDLNERVKIEQHSDYEFNPFLDPAQTRSERAEPEAQELQIATKSQAENGIELNMSPLSPEEEVTIIKSIESEQPREFVSVSLLGKHGSVPFRSIVQALPSSRTISLFNKRWSGPMKKAKRGANVEIFTRSKARKGSNLDSNFGVHKDDNHSLSTSSYIPESHHNQKYSEKRSLSSLLEMKSGRSWTKTGKRRRRKQRIEESGKVMREISRSNSKTRGSFLVSEKEEQEKSAAEALVDMSSSDSARKSSIKTSDCVTPLLWFAKIASSVVTHSETAPFSIPPYVTRFHFNYQMDYFEAMTLQLTEEQRTSTSVSIIVHPKNKRTPRSKGKRQQLHKDGHSEYLPSQSSFAGNEASQDLQKIGRLIEASETNDTHSSYKSLMENMRFDWGTIRKRRRGIRSPAANTKTCRAFLQVPFSGS
ncbi:hypothetical protein V5N11_009976 [Cardamine amara subsp. amara]|uniref:Uncharacterized protein n=1 Tax=Cardamine amara subsp. amara TaxID=228776 RepID=A0ABD1B492_CARAN